MSNTIAEQPSNRDIKVLSAEAINLLLTRGDNPQLRDGYRAVSNTSYSSAISQATVLIPDKLHSLETLKFLELNDATAQLVWDQFRRNFDEDPDCADIYQIVTHFIRQIPGNAFSEEDDWLAAMEQMGLSSDFKARIMDAEFKDMRLSGSGKGWVLDMMEMRFEFLMSLDGMVKRLSTKSKNQEVCHMDADGRLKTVARPEIPPRGSSKPPPAW